MIDPSIPLQAQPSTRVQSPAELMGIVLAIQRGQQQQKQGEIQLQESQLEMQAKKRAMAAEDALNAAMSNALRPDGTIDMDRFGQAVAGTPAASKFPAVAKAMAEMQEQQGKVLEYRNKAAKSEADFAGSLANAADTYDDPNDKASVLVTGLASGRQSGIIPPDHVSTIISGMLDDAGNPDPAKVIATIKQLRAASEEQRKLGSEEATSGSRVVEADVAKQRLGAQLKGLEAESAMKQQEAASMEGGVSAEKRIDQALRAREIGIQGSRLALDQKRSGEATSGGGAATSNVAETVKGMKDGTLPPMLPGRASKDYIAIMAEAHRQNYDLANAATDWMATQKHIQTMNGAQQLRLNQSINALPELLDSVDELAKKWKGGHFPILNKANLALAKGGAYGSQASSIANQLDAQIADVVADLGNVYMGGNSPTDHALELAARSLKTEWDEKVLHDMVVMAKNNVKIRKNSINNTGVAGASEGNPYAPAPPPRKLTAEELIKKYGG